MRLEIKSLLSKKNKTVYWLAKNTDMCFNSISSIINNKTKSISFDTLEKICIALECTPNDIIILDEKN